MLWAKETELINLEPVSEAQSILGYVTGILANDSRLFSSYGEAGWI